MGGVFQKIFKKSDPLTVACGTDKILVVMENGLTKTSLFLQQWHEGNQDGLNALLERHLPWIKGQVRKRLTPPLRNKAETVDYIQDVVVQFLHYAPKFTVSKDAQFRALLLRVVENTLMNKYEWYTARRRQMARERPLPSDTVLSLDPPERSFRTPSQSVARHEEEAWIRLAMEFLETDDREIIVLREWDKLPYAEIGARLDITANTARMRHDRAVIRLSEKVWDLRSGKLDRFLEIDG